MRVIAVLGFLASPLILLLGIWGVMAFWPYIPEIFAPGSGGGAQMVVAIFVVPMFLACVAATIGGAVGMLLFPLLFLRSHD